MRDVNTISVVTSLVPKNHKPVIERLRQIIIQLDGHPELVQPQTKDELTREAMYLIRDRRALEHAEFSHFNGRMDAMEIEVINLWHDVVLPENTRVR